MLTETVYIGCSHDVTYTGARLAADGTPLTGGSCEWNLFQSDRKTSIDFGAVPRVGTGNDYAGTLPPVTTARLERGKLYWLQVTFAQGTLADEHWILCEADYRP